MTKPLFCHFLVANVKLINGKNSLNVTVRMVVKPFSEPPYNSTSWGYPGILKCSQILVFLAAFIDRLP